MTIKDLLLADEYDLSSIPGISESGAEFYKLVATETALFFKGRFHIVWERIRTCMKAIQSKKG